MTPDINYADNSSIPTQNDGVERAKLQARIEALEKDLAIIENGKLAAERALRYEREKARELAQNGVLSLKRDWVALSNELKQLKGELISEDAKENEEYQEALCIDFVNRLRMGALAELESDDDETLFVKARAYEVWYKACVAKLQNRSLRLKIEGNEKFEQSKKDDKARKIAVEKERQASRRRTPEEKLLESCISLGMSEEQAKIHIKTMADMAKNIQVKQ